MKFFDAVKTGMGMTIGFLVTLAVMSKVTNQINVRLGVDNEDKKEEE